MSKAVHAEANQFAGRVMLVVEDEPLVGLDVADALTSCGGATCGAYCVPGVYQIRSSSSLSAFACDALTCPRVLEPGI